VPSVGVVVCGCGWVFVGGNSDTGNTDSGNTDSGDSDSGRSGANSNH
jgi:hypothetical protein